MRAIGNKHLEYAIARLVQFLSDNGWLPNDITDAHLERFYEYLETVVNHTDPWRAWYVTCLRWNQAIKEVPTWPKNPVSVPHKPRQRESYWINWLEVPKLETQLSDFRRWLTKVDYFKEDGAKARKPTTVAKYEDGLRAYLSALKQRGFNIADFSGFLSLVDPDTYKEGLRFFLDRNEGKTSSYTHAVAAAVYALARYLEERKIIDAKHLAEIKSTFGKVKLKRKGLVPKNKAMLRQFSDQRNLANILYLPAKLCKGIRTDRRPTKREAKRVEYAVAVEILLVFPIREANLVGLHLKNNIVRTGLYRDAEVLIVIPGAGVKNGEDLEVKLPRESAELLEFYLRHCHPVLTPKGSEWLFPGQKGGHKHPQAFGAQLQRVIRREIGLKMTLHFFRHLSAKHWLDRNPGQFKIIQKTLGHRSLETTLNFYAEFSSLQASALFDEHVLKLRDELAPLVGPLGLDRAKKHGRS
jgi:integrase